MQNPQIQSEIQRRTAEIDAIAKSIELFQQEQRHAEYNQPYWEEKCGGLRHEYLIKFSPSCLKTISETVKADIVTQINAMETELATKTADLNKFIKINKYGA